MDPHQQTAGNVYYNISHQCSARKCRVSSNRHPSSAAALLLGMCLLLAACKSGISTTIHFSPTVTPYVAPTATPTPTNVVDGWALTPLRLYVEPSQNEQPGYQTMLLDYAIQNTEDTLRTYVCSTSFTLSASVNNIPTTYQGSFATYYGEYGCPHTPVIPNEAIRANAIFENVATIATGFSVMAAGSDGSLTWTFPQDIRTVTFPGASTAAPLTLGAPTVQAGMRTATLVAAYVQAYCDEFGDVGWLLQVKVTVKNNFNAQVDGPDILVEDTNGYTYT
jgi:hypothetical protein